MGSLFLNIFRIVLTVAMVTVILGCGSSRYPYAYGVWWESSVPDDRDWAINELKEAGMVINRVKKDTMLNWTYGQVIHRYGEPYSDTIETNSEHVAVRRLHYRFQNKGEETFWFCWNDGEWVATTTISNPLGAIICSPYLDSVSKTDTETLH